MLLSQNVPVDVSLRLKKAMQYIEMLDLDYLVVRLVTKENWDQREAENAVRRYKNFLILLCKYPGFPFPPALDMDEAWHAHILHTKKYMHDCEQIFGKYQHHSPLSATEDTEKLDKVKEAGILAAQLYGKEFEEPYHGILDVSSFWG